MGLMKHKDELILFLNKQVLISLRDGTSVAGILVDWTNEVISYEKTISNEPFIRKIYDIERWKIYSIALLSNPTKSIVFPEKRGAFF